MSLTDPHGGQPVLTAGPKPADAGVTMILVHGRGASAEKILPVGLELRLDDEAFVVPNAGGNTWYPQSFLAPIEQNEPGISSGLRMLSRLVESLNEQGVDATRIGLLGFSQGACLTLEFAARHARRYAGVFGLSGGLIGPPGTSRDYPGNFDGTPIFLGCSDVDAHIPLARVHESADVLRRLGAMVDERIYPGMGHLVNDDEIRAVREMLRSTGSR